MWRVDIIDVAKYPKIHRTAPYRKESSSPNVNIAKVENNGIYLLKMWEVVCHFWLGLSYWIYILCFHIVFFSPKYELTLALSSHLCKKYTVDSWFFSLPVFICFSKSFSLIWETNYWFPFESGVMSTDQYHCRVLRYTARRLEIPSIIKLKRLLC